MKKRMNCSREIIFTSSMEYFGAEKNQGWTDEYKDGPFDPVGIITE